MVSQNNEIIRSILTDNLEQAGKFLAQSRYPELEELANLLDKTPRNRVPLARWNSPLPKFITTSVCLLYTSDAADE